MQLKHCCLRLLLPGLKNVGPKREALYLKLGIQTVEQLLAFYPRSYQDFTSPKTVDQCVGGENVVVAGKILRKFPPAPIRKGMVFVQIAGDGRTAQFCCHHF